MQKKVFQRSLNYIFSEGVGGAFPPEFSHQMLQPLFLNFLYPLLQIMLKINAQLLVTKQNFRPELCWHGKLITQKEQIFLISLFPFSVGCCSYGLLQWPCEAWPHL